jgi:type II secretory pathway component GspD/PulD (secretin)
VEVSFSSGHVDKSQARDSYSLIAPVSQRTETKDEPGTGLSTAMAKNNASLSVPSGNKLHLCAEDGRLAGKEMRIKVADAEAAGLLRELGKKAGRTVHFRDCIEARVGLDIVADDIVDAMEKVAEQAGARITDEDGDLWVSLQNNPVLKFSDSDHVEGADLSGLALGDALRALGQICELNVVVDSSLEAVKDRRLDMYLYKMSIRRAFETVLKANMLNFRMIDEKTVLVMTVEKSRELEGRVLRVLKTSVPIEKTRALIEQSVSTELFKRVSLQEDLGNLVISGDKEAVDVIQTVFRSIETRLNDAGEGLVREYFHPVNTRAEELISLVSSAIDKSENVKISHDRRTDMLLVSGASTSVARAMQMIRRLDLEPTRQALIHIRLIEISRSDLDEMGIKFPEQLAAVDDIGNIKASTVVLPATFRGFAENSRIKTLANPTLRCMDKEEASIDISEQIPVKNTVTEYLPIASASLAARTSDNWTTSEVGIKLNLKPTIHRDDEISMAVDVDLTELIKLVEGHPWTARRVVKTMVRVRDRETVVIGGLIRNKTDRKRNPVPLLSRIPLLRRLVRRIEYRDTREEKSEMVIRSLLLLLEAMTEFPENMKKERLIRLR